MIPGKYTATVLRHDFGHSSQKGTPHFHVSFEVLSETGSESVAGDIWLTEAAMGMARKSLKAMGFDPDTEDLQTLVDNPIKLIGRECSIVVVEEEGQDGEFRTKVAFINPLSEPPKAGEIAGIAKALKDVKGSKKVPKADTTKAIEKHFAPKADVKQTAEKGDDIPF